MVGVVGVCALQMSLKLHNCSLEEIPVKSCLIPKSHFIAIVARSCVNILENVEEILFGDTHASPSRIL